jgi:hypothetical protein
MRSFSVLLGATIAVLAFSAATPGALADDDPPELARKLTECLKQHGINANVACSEEQKACTERIILEGNRRFQLKKGMTYEEVLTVMGRQPDNTDSITYGNGVVAKIYGWFSFGRTNYVSASFIDGRLSEIGGLIADTFRPDPEISCGW